MTMNRERIRSGKATSGIHTLVNAEPERARPSGRVLLIMSVAVAAGVAVALAWLSQLPHGSLEMLPDAVAEATKTQAAIAIAAEESTALPVVTATGAAEVALVALDNANARVGMAASVGNLSAQNAPAKQGTVPPPTPTATSTPEPPLESVEAVVAIGGADVWDEETGVRVGDVPQGELLTATARSEDGNWLYVTLPDGTQGWTAIDQVIVFDADRLAVEPMLVTPIAITPTPVAGESASTAQTESASAEDDEMILRPTPVGGDVPTARVAVTDSRLNLRAGPASTYPVIAKALPDETFMILGRDATGEWLQLSLPDIVGNFAWAAAEFLDTDANIDELPVSDEVSDAPAYQEGQEEERAPEGPMGNQPPQAEPNRPIPTDAQGAAPAQGILKGRHPVAPIGAVFSGKLAIQLKWGGDIYIYDFATDELRLLTGGFDPAISPDGTQVAFTRAGGEHGLYLIGIDGSNERLIFSGRELLRSPKWSPDGQYIVFERGDEYIRCFQLNPEDPASACVPGENTGREVQEKLARVDFNGQNYQDIPVLPRARVPDWNSAGIVYQSPAGIQMTQDQPDAVSKLVFFNIQKQYELDPDWQPNGGRIIFQRRENDHWEIYSVGVDGSGLTALTYPEYTLVPKLPSNVAPAWSPDGRYIVYLSNREPNQSAGMWRVWVMNADGSNKRTIGLGTELDFTYTFVAEQMLDWGR